MSKENNCRCVVCDIERGLLNSLSTQIARTQFQVLALNHPTLNHFDSPADVITRLHEQERVEDANHKAWNGILHALVESIADRTAEEIGQQLLLLAFMPAIHRTYAEVCQLFPALGADDIAQQASLVFLEATRTRFVTSQNGYLPVALAKEFRRRLFRWAFLETRRSLSPEEVSTVQQEPESNENFEDAVLLEDLLSQWQRAGVLSQEECDLLRKFKCDGFHFNELDTGEGGPSANALYFRVYRAINRLRRFVGGEHAGRNAHTALKEENSNNFRPEAQTFSESVAISNSEKGNSPELSHRGPQVEPEVPPVAA
jgi:hypothetical protein